MPLKGKQPLSFKLLKVTDLNINIESLTSLSIKGIDGNNLSVTIDFEINPNEKDNVVFMPFVAQYVYDKKQNGGLTGILTYRNLFEFRVENYSRRLSSLSEKTIDQEMYMIMINLIGVAISTTRGILIEKVSNTQLRGLIMPILNPVDVFRRKYPNENS